MLTLYTILSYIYYVQLWNDHKIIGTHIRPCTILLQFNIHIMYIIEKGKLMKIYYSKLPKCQLIVRNIGEFLYYSHNNFHFYQINKLVENNILITYKHNYCYCHYFLIKSVYLFIYTYRSYYYVYLFEETPEIYLELITRVTNVKCLTRFVYIPHCMSHGLAHYIAQVCFQGHRTMTQAVNNNIIVPISHRMSVIINQTFPNIHSRSYVPNNIRFKHERPVLFYFHFGICRLSSPQFILLLNCLCTQTSVFTGCYVFALLFVVYVIVRCILLVCVIFNCMYLGYGIGGELCFHNYSIHITFSMPLKRGCSILYIRNLITLTYTHNNTYSINVSYNSIDCMPLFIIKQCYSRNYILLCTLMCKVYTIECTLPRPCAYILYTLHIIVLIAKYNPCNIGQVLERSDCERMFGLTCKHSGNHVRVNSCFIESDPDRYMVGQFMYILVLFHGNLVLLYRVAVYNSAGKHVRVCLWVCKCFCVIDNENVFESYRLHVHIIINMKCCWTFKYEYICIIDGKVCCLYLGMLLGYCRLDQEYTDLMLCLYLDYVYKCVCVSKWCVQSGGDWVYDIEREEVCENYYSCLKCEPIYQDNELIHIYHEFTLSMQKNSILVLLDIYVILLVLLDTCIYVILLVLLSVNITIKYGYICKRIEIISNLDLTINFSIKKTISNIFLMDNKIVKYNVIIIEILSMLVIYVVNINSMSHFYYYLFGTIVLIILHSCIQSHEHVACKSLYLSKGKMKGGGNNVCIHPWVFLTYRDFG